jgi:multidrug resistance efflux pump
MKIELATVGRIAASVIVVIAAILVARELWIRYRIEPWTRDGRVRADIVQVAPDVSGLVTEVQVHDNQAVKAGDVLFVLDRPRYELAVEQADATVSAIHAQISQAQRENKRNRDLTDLVSSELKEQSGSKLQQLAAQLQEAQSLLATAKLNLTRTEIKASVRGIVTNLELRPGSFASAGRPVMALVDLDSLYVVGYFEETKLGCIDVGDDVEVRLMGDDRLIRGHVDGIAGGVEDRDRVAGTDLLASVNPTFNWVRLAQRIPVRIHLDRVPVGVKLVMGRTATVQVLNNGACPSGPVLASQAGHP